MITWLDVLLILFSGILVSPVIDFFYKRLKVVKK